MPQNVPNFALPGLMNITRPLLDAQRRMTPLAPHRVQDTNWVGIPSVGPISPGGAAPTNPLAEVRMIIGLSMPIGDNTVYILSSSPAAGQGTVTIDNDVTRMFHVPPQPLPLGVFVYFWELHTIDTEGNTTVYYAGTLPVTS